MIHAAQIIRTKVPIARRTAVVEKLFGLQFPLRLEPMIYCITDHIAPAYQGAYWEFYTLDNFGFYMAPSLKESFHVSCENQFEGEMSADALGITACLYAYSHLSFADTPGLGQTCANHYHWLRAYMLEHPEAQAILGAID